MTPPSQAAPFVPDWRLHPGEVLAKVLDARGVRQSELATRTGLSAKHINQLIKKNIGVSGDVALRLERALGVPAEFWMQADADYAAFTSRRAARKDLPELITWSKSFDAPTLRKFRIVGPADDKEMVVEKLLAFFGVAGIQPFEDTWLRPKTSFRRSQAFTVEGNNTALWLRLLDRCAGQHITPAYSPAKARKAIRSIPALTTLPFLDGMLAAKRQFGEAGINVVFLREVSKTRVSGTTWWLDAEHPVVGITERHRREDMLWFSLVHEIGHVLLHPKRQTFLDLDGDKAHPDGAEEEADRFARNALIPVGGAEQIAQASSREQLAELAARFGVGASIVAGCHGYLTQNWKVGAPLRRSVTDQEFDELESVCLEAA